MAVTQFTCPQCLTTLAGDGTAKFCPRCGMAIQADADAEPLKLRTGGQEVVVRDRLAFGEVANLYRCDLPTRHQSGIFKIARTAGGNRHVLHEADVLARLHQAEALQKYTAFLPKVVASVAYGVDGELPRQASVLAYHEGINTPDELYSLEEVRAAHPAGIDAKDMSWMWRRLLTVLGAIHDQRTIHACVTPDHILIEPREHKLVLIGFCGAAHPGQPLILTPARWRDWGAWSSNASPATDLALAAKSMRYLLGSNPEPAIIRHLDRAAEASSWSSTSAWKLLDDFDRMIEALWGPRRFRPFNMPARRV